MQTDNQVTGGVWPLASPADEPEIVVQDWEIHEVQLPGRPDRTRHVVGLQGWHREGLVSSAITAIDAATLKVTTESGRVYILGTRTGGNLDSEYVWNRWRHINNAKDDENVTAQLKQPMAISHARACIADAERSENSMATQVDAAILAIGFLGPSPRDPLIAKYLRLKYTRPVLDEELAPYLMHALSLAKLLLSKREQS
ncbi:MAG: hypothetical protein Q7K57_48620 [Burkholderiaceae bacterium]|nr:hypothetical protein [Burkholderiaceae bacterium]